MVKGSNGGALSTPETKIEGHPASLRNRASAMGKSAASTVEDAAKRAGAQISDIGERLAGEGRRARRSFRSTVAEDPMATVLLAAAFGFGVGYLLHRRR